MATRKAVRAEIGQSGSLAVVLIFLISLVNAFRGLTSSYSYWVDELFSVFASSDNWGDLYRAWILPDVHPPLYPIVLKLWIAFLGDSELATRSLSFLFAVVTLMTFSVVAIKSRLPRRILALALIGASPAFAYYAQETRSYSMALMLSSVLTLLALHCRVSDSGAAESKKGCSRAVIVSLYVLIGILLSLTHYFGWIYVFVLTVLDFFRGRVIRMRLGSLLVIAAISVWPICHVLFGEIGSKTAGRFWIEVTPLLGTVNAYLQGCFRPLAYYGSTLTFIMAWSLLVSLFLVVVPSIRGPGQMIGTKDQELAVSEQKFLGTTIAGMLVIAIVVDMHTPMSTNRNFIVLLPATVLFVSNSLSSLAGSGPKEAQGDTRKIASFGLTIVIIALLAASSYKEVAAKIAPAQNWKALALYVERSRICDRGCLAMGYGDFDFHLQYFNKKEHGSIVNLSGVPGASSGILASHEQWKLIKDFPRQPVLGFHRADPLKKIRESVGGSTCLQPKQSWVNGTFVVVPNELLTGDEEKMGLTPCQG